METGLLNVEVKGLKDLTKALKKYPEISEPIFQKALEATAATFAKHTLKDDPVPWRTGMLTQTFVFETKPDLPPLQVKWRPTRLYAPYVEFGTRRMAARPFMGTIIDKSRLEVDELMSDALDIVLRNIAKA